MSEHTEGPWEATRSTANRTCWDVRATGPRDSSGFTPHIAYVGTWLTTDNLDELEANARLIVAAPNMKAELEGVARAISDWIDGKPYKIDVQKDQQRAVLQSINAVLAKGASDE